MIFFLEIFYTFLSTSKHRSKIQNAPAVRKRHVSHNTYIFTIQDLQNHMFKFRHLSNLETVHETCTVRYCSYAL